MTKAFAPFNIDLDTKRAPTETDFIQFMRDGLMQQRIYWDGAGVVFPTAAPGRIATGGTTLTTSAVTFSGNWGDGPSRLVQAASNDSRGAFGMHTGPSSNPSGSRTCTLTFADGPYAVAPLVLVQRRDGLANLSLPNLVAVTVTGFTVTVSNVGLADVDDLFYYICAG